METSLILSIIIAVVSLLMVPFCMFYCKRCAIRIIDNVGSTSTNNANSTNINGTSSNNHDYDDNDNYNGSNTSNNHSGRFRWNTSTRRQSDDDGNNINGTRLTLEERKERIKREKKILKRVVVKVRSNWYHMSGEIKKDLNYPFHELLK